MEQFKPQLLLKLSGNIAKSFMATGADENVKIVILLHTIGEEALEFLTLS